MNNNNSNSNVEVFSNIIGKEKLREIQKETLKVISDALENSFGPYGSNTIIYEGDQALPRFTKDGHTILTRLQFAGEIEQSVLIDIKEETRTQALKVGDSTTSIAILSNLIFYELAAYDKSNVIPPADLVAIFRKVVELISDKIGERAMEFTPELAKKISYIATNGNEEYSDLIYNVYNKYGKDVYIDVKASMSGKTYYDEINGMNFDYGYMDISFINNPETNKCELDNPKIYFFRDPIDTMEMGKIVDGIINKNLMRDKHDTAKVVPTLIVAPKFTRDFSRFIDSIIAVLNKTKYTDKFPLCIVTGTSSIDEEELDEIRHLCDAQWIQKYLDPRVQEKDIAAGKAINLESEFKFNKSIGAYEGSAKKVIVSKTHTTIIGPKKRYNADGSDTDEYKNRVQWLEDSIAEEENSTHDNMEIFKLKKRLNSLKGNMVEIYVGGITSADRDQERDLVEDAVLNCRSAAKNGVGLGANVEGYIASNVVFDQLHDELKEKGKIEELGPKFNKAVYYNAAIDMVNIIRFAYIAIIAKLYNGFLDDAELTRMLDQVQTTNKIYNLRERCYDSNVVTSIDTDKWVLYTISKIITIMVTSNQITLSRINTNNY